MCVRKCTPEAFALSFSHTLDFEVFLKAIASKVCARSLLWSCPHYHKRIYGNDGQLLISGKTFSFTHLSTTTGNDGQLLRVDHITTQIINIIISRKDANAFVFYVHIILIIFSSEKVAPLELLLTERLMIVNQHDVVALEQALSVALQVPFL